MDDQGERPRWDDNSNIPDAPSRRPLPSSTIDAIQNLNLTDQNQIKAPEEQSTPVTTSRLSADAKEFVPAIRRLVSVQDRLKVKHQQEPHGHQSTSEIVATNGICVDDDEHDDSDLPGFITEVQQLISILIDDPGQFDYIWSQFVEALAPFNSDGALMDDVAKLIFTEAINETNFRYSAARLCKILEEEFPCFRSAIHLHVENLIPNHHVNFERDLALTLAELYAQSNCDNMYGNYVVQILEKIVCVENLDNIKCVCQVLKLTGAALDIHHRSKMNLIINQLETVKPAVPSLTNMIDYVISLRSSNWGQVEINNYSAVGDRCSPGEGPIFYGPDGKELSEDEKQFLAENCIELFSEDLDSDPDELFDPDNEMSEEVHAAFREFTKAQQN